MIYPLDTNITPTLAQVGGKGLSLIEMTQAGLPVPAGFILAAEAYDTFVAENDLQSQLLDLAGAVSASDPQSSERASMAIHKLFLAAEMPEIIRADLLAAYAALSHEGEVAVAVRSSATTEDLPSASFAGQHESYLNVQGQDALLDAVVACWASLWTARAISYRARHSVDPATLSLAVVVQRLIAADAAGVLFTANPVDGAREQMVINAAWGLGEAIVGGRVTPDTLLVDRASQRILTRETATKRIMTVRAAQGTKERPVPTAQQDQQVLDDGTTLELARIGAQVEAHFGLPMDIEWALADGEISMLQARPITHLPPAPLTDVRWDPPTPGTIWMRRQIVEHMPEPLSPLFDELYVQHGLDHSMETLADFLGDLSGMEINVWDFVDPPFAATVNGYAYSRASFRFSPRIIPTVLRMYAVVLPKMIRHLIPRWREESLPGYLAVIDRWKGIDLPTTPDAELLRGVRQLAAEDAAYWFAAAVPLGLARVTDTALDRFLKWASPASYLTSGSLLRGFPSKAAQAQAQLEAIARKIDSSSTLCDLVLGTPALQLLPALAAHPEGQAVMDDLRSYLNLYGHQIYNLDFAAPTLADDPLPIMLSLKTAVAHPERDTRSRQAELVRERETLVAGMERSLNPIERSLFQRLWGWAQRFSPLREEALFYVGAGWPVLRRLALELGRRLAEAGSLDTPDDLFYLESAELAAASSARAEGLSRPELASLARERRALRDARKRLEPPISVPPHGRMKFGPIDMAMFEPKPRTISTGPILDGFAVSPGQVTAPASIIRSPEDFDKMAPDSILVCHTTTPAWTPLFAQAQGLVTDIGGALAHGSIVAREYGIPAVMGTGAATQRIKAGQRIRVDGDRGTVTLVDEIGPLEEATMRSRRLARKKAAARKQKAVLALVVGAALALIFWWKKRR